jgi:hypothetical protein
LFLSAQVQRETLLEVYHRENYLKVDLYQRARLKCEIEMMQALRGFVFIVVTSLSQKMCGLQVISSRSGQLPGRLSG